jgi:hypothetical protein
MQNLWQGSEIEMPCDQPEYQYQRAPHSIIEVAKVFTKRKPTTDITNFHLYLTNLVAIIRK